MPIYQLPEQLVFPPVEMSEPDGLLAIGGDLSPSRLLLAYSQGIFPWFSEGEPLLWWSPDPRSVIFPEELKVSKSMRNVLNRGMFRISFDQAFQEVMTACSEMPRRGQDGTWITEEMVEAYCELHALGFAHSVEVWRDEELVGGLYGLSMGSCFFGESMFSKESNASKAGFITMVRTLQDRGFSLIDCQVHNSHLESLGAREIPREEFLQLLEKGLKNQTMKGNWAKLLNSPQL